MLAHRLSDLRQFAEMPPAGGEMPMQAAAGGVPIPPKDLPFQPYPQGVDLQRLMEIIRQWQGRAAPMNAPGK